MKVLHDIVCAVIQDFVRNSALFTALDVSNEVKKVFPLTRHREVRDVVRDLYATEIESASYAKTPITVQLADGTTAEALLYHPLMDSWDLDAKYDAQKRAQTAARPGVYVQTTPVPVSVPAFSAPALKVVVTPQPAPAPAQASVINPVATPSRTLWDNLFKGQPSLFPVNKS